LRPLAAPLALAVVFAAPAAGPIRSAGTDAQAPIARFTLHDDFQGDSLAQWASYPPAQDTGYEPSLAPTARFDAPGGRSLMRVVRPGGPGPLRIGFIKHVPFIADAATKLSFSYRIEAPGRSATIEVGLAGASGRRYVARAPAIVGAWAPSDFIGEAFATKDGAKLADREAIEALYLTATVAESSPDVTYRFLLDEVRLAAVRAATFTVVTPATRALNPWPELISEVGYRAGSKLAVEVVAPVRMTEVECRVAPQGARAPAAGERLYDDGTHGDRQAGDGRWTSDVVRVLTPEDPSGLWTATIRGTAAGSVVETKMRFLVHAGNIAHPRLYFDGADRGRLVERTRHPRLVALWKQFEERAKASRTSGDITGAGRVFAMLDREYLLPSLLGYFDAMNRGRQRIAANAIVAYVRDDAEAAGAAKAALLDVSRWERWAPPWFEAHGQHTYYPAGQLAAAVALGYDLLHGTLTLEERQIVRHALIERSILPTWREYVLDNRVMVHTSNWIAHTVGGALIAASAIEGDTTADEQARIEAAVNGLLLKIESHMAASFLPDGSYGEGISYQEFDLETLGPMLHALERVFGIDYWSRTRVLDSLAYPLSTLADPVADSLDMGDTHAPAGHGLAPVVSRSKDPVIRWYASRFQPRTIEDFLFFDDHISPRPPPSPGSRLFADKGNVVFRTGWEKDDAVLLFRAGPNFNHHHADQGAFLFRAYGETLAAESGWSHYYNDPYYATYFTQAAGHNTVLVDGDPESQSIADTPQFRALDDYPRITGVALSDTVDLVASDLASVYKRRLSRYTRRLVFMKPHYLLVYDDLQARDTPARFNWLLHLPDKARVRASGQDVHYAGARAALDVRSLLPGATFDVRDGRLPYATFDARTPFPVPAQPAYLDLHTGAAALSHRFLVALVPAQAADAVPATGPAKAGRHSFSMVAIDEAPWKGVGVTRGAAIDVALFRGGDAPGPARYSEWLADADAWITTHEGSRLVQLAGEGLTRIERSGRLVVAADHPVSLVLRYSERDAVVDVFARQPTRVRLGGTDRAIDVPSGASHLRVPMDRIAARRGAGHSGPRGAL
jgi:hypothetical protein